MIRNEIPSVFLFCEMVRNGIPSIYFCALRVFVCLCVYCVSFCVNFQSWVFHHFVQGQDFNCLNKGQVWSCYPALQTTSFIYRGMVRNEIAKFRVFFLFYEMEQNFEHFFLLRNDSERYFFERFSFRETDGIPTEWIKISVCFVFRGKIFVGKW